MIVWIDTETTGLNAREGHILEVACIVTTDHLLEVAAAEWVTDVARRPIDWSKVGQYVREMHAKNGLWCESITRGLPVEDVGAQLAVFVASNLPPETSTDVSGKPAKPPLGGSTVSFDREYLGVHMPAVLAHLHYRNIDVSSVMELSRRVWPAVAVYKANDSGANAPHRAMYDIRQSIDLARWYADALAPRPPESLAVLRGERTVSFAPGSVAFSDAP
jgi:oligoribonuclease